MGGILRGNMDQFVNDYIGDPACHDSLAFAGSLVAKFRPQHSGDLIAVDKDESLDSPVEEMNPSESTAIPA